MPTAPTALVDAFANCIDYDFIVLGTTHTDDLSYKGLIIGGTVDDTQDVDDMTNQGGGGGKESVNTTHQLTGTIIIGWPTGTGSPPAIKRGEIWLAAVDGGPDRPYFQGKFKFTKLSYPILDPKVGLKVTYTYETQGLYLTVRPVGP